MTLPITLPVDDLAFARWRARYFAQEWFGETPIRLHEPYKVAPDGAPAMHRDFENYLEGALFAHRHRNDETHSRRHLDIEDDPRRRVTKAFRKLRQKAPREFDVLYSMCVIDQVGRGLSQNDEKGLIREFEASLRRTTARLNKRERSKSTPRPLVSESDVLVLAVSGIRKLSLWAG